MPTEAPRSRADKATSGMIAPNPIDDNVVGPYADAISRVHSARVRFTGLLET